jgi:hypothetical protein
MAKTGAGFEMEVRDYVQASINAGECGIDPAAAVVRHKAEYWSDKREATIITDVSVELYRPKQKNFWFLWVIECKDLGKLVPVDDVEEFYAKMGQINAHKGTMASRQGFSKGCTTFAQKSGIGLFRLTPAGAELVLNVADEWQFTPVDFVEGAPEHNMPGNFAGFSFDGESTLSSKTFFKRELKAALTM